MFFSRRYPDPPSHLQPTTRVIPDLYLYKFKILKIKFRSLEIK